METVFEFLVSVRNHYHINKLYLFWDTLYMYLLKPSTTQKTWHKVKFFEAKYSWFEIGVQE